MEETTLIPIKKLDVAVVFTDKGLEEILSEIERIAMAHVADVTSEQGRSDIKSLAYKVARSKTVIDSFGKDVIADWKKKTDNINAYRKRARDFLDPLRDRVRKPLTDWEAEQERINAEKEAAEQARIQDMVDAFASVGRTVPFFDLATMSDDEFTKLYNATKKGLEAEQSRIAEEKRLETERLEKERLEREAEAKRLADERAELDKIKAEQESERAKLKAEQEAIEVGKQAIADAARRHQEKIDREAFEKQALENARIATENAAKDKAEREAKEKVEAEQRARDEAERQEALKPDKEKLIRYAASVIPSTFPTVIAPEAQVVVAEIKKRLISLTSYILKAAKEKAEREAAEKVEAERRAKEEAERAEKLRPDREKLLSFANSLLEIRAPEVSDTRAQDVADTAIAEICRIANRIIKQSKDL